MKNQDNCGSCCAFARVTLLDVQYAFRLKTSASLSEQQIVDCSPLDNCYDDGYFTNTFQYLANNAYRISTQCTLVRISRLPVHTLHVSPLRTLVVFFSLHSMLNVTSLYTLMPMYVYVEFFIYFTHFL